jgi:hypothetical protein
MLVVPVLGRNIEGLFLPFKLLSAGIPDEGQFESVQEFPSFSHHFLWSGDLRASLYFFPANMRLLRLDFD